VRYDRFVDIDPTVFRTSCTYKNLVPGSTTELQTLNCTQGSGCPRTPLQVLGEYFGAGGGDVGSPCS